MATGVRSFRRSATAVDVEVMRKTFAGALVRARLRGRFADFSDIIRRGQVGLEYIVSLGGKDRYIKAAGDALQTKWLALHRADPGHAFTYNAAQAAFSLWIDLPRLVHGKELGTTVAAWKEHALADHNEALTCVLSPKMLHAYMELQACFHRLYLDKGHGQTLCTWREGTGALCPRKRRWDTAFCKEHARLAAPPACLLCT